jgi:hypothetical protein
MSDAPDTRLAQIKARAEKATEGPWVVFEHKVADNGWTVDRRIGTEWIHGQLHGPLGVVNQFASVAPVGGDKSLWHGVSISKDDAEFIAHCRSDVPFLIEQVEGKGTCVWSQNVDGGWETGCGGSFEFMDDGPAENHFRYCYSCGKSIVAEPGEPR